MKTPPKLSKSSVVQAVECLLHSGAKSARVYQHPKLTVTATHHGRPDRRDRSFSIVLTIGKPNFAARKFVKAAIEAGEPFPIKKTQLKFYPLPKKKQKRK